MPHRILRKKARTLQPPGHTLTSVTWGHPVKQPYPPTPEAAALLPEKKVEDVQPFQKKPKTEDERNAWGWGKKSKNNAMILAPLPLTPAFISAPPPSVPKAEWAQEDPWQHHSRYFPEYTPIHPALTAPAQNSQMTSLPPVMGSQLHSSATWQHV